MLLVDRRDLEGERWMLLPYGAEERLWTNSNLHASHLVLHVALCRLYAEEDILRHKRLCLEDLAGSYTAGRSDGEQKLGSEED